MKIRISIALMLIPALLIIAICAGEEWINPWHMSGMEATIFWDLRLPRLLIGFSVIGAFAGAWLGIAVVMAFSHLGPSRVLLAGVVLAAFWAALLALLLALLPERGLGRAFAWMMGDLSHSDIPVPLLLMVWTVALGCGMWLSRALDMLLLGERHAEALGVDVKSLRRRLLLMASAVTAIAVTAAGTIGFVGLVVPHLMRLIFGSLHRFVLPASAVGGGLLLLLADTAARTVIAPAELPVGVLTAMIGVPVFLCLLLRRAS